MGLIPSTTEWGGRVKVESKIIYVLSRAPKKASWLLGAEPARTPRYAYAPKHSRQAWVCTGTQAQQAGLSVHWHTNLASKLAFHFTLLIGRTTFSYADPPVVCLWSDS